MRTPLRAANRELGQARGRGVAGQYEKAHLYGNFVCMHLVCGGTVGTDQSWCCRCQSREASSDMWVCAATGQCLVHSSGPVCWAEIPPRARLIDRYGHSVTVARQPKRGWCGSGCSVPEEGLDRRTDGGGRWRSAPACSS
jgi:hypothetical protein